MGLPEAPAVKVDVDPGLKKTFVNCGENLDFIVEQW
jgi:hypothetical protein